MTELSDSSFSIYSINTGHIYQELTENWRKYPRDLFPKLEEKLQRVLSHAKIITASDDNDASYFEIREDRIFAAREKAKRDLESSPTTDFFIVRTKKGYNLTAYIHSFELSRITYPEFFDFFFALSLLICDEMEIGNFLEYHLINSFNNNFLEYKQFLTPLFVKYSELLENGKIDIIYKNFMNEKNSDPKKNQNDEVSGARKVLAIHYLFEKHISEGRVNSAKIRFIQMVTGLGKDWVKELVKSPLTNKANPAKQKEDLEFVRRFFEDLKMDKILEEIDSDIQSINNNKKT